MLRVKAPTARREAYALPLLHMEFERIGACHRPYNATPVGIQEFDRLHPLSHT